MNYIKIYQSLIIKRQKNIIDNGEKHHIVPRCLGGTNDKNNIVRLTIREHFIAHLLLSKMYPKDSIEWIKMNLALNMMKCGRDISSRKFEYFRKNISKAASIDQSQMIWITDGVSEKRIRNNEIIPKNWYRGRTRNWSGHTDETKYFFSKLAKNRKVSKETRLKISENNFSVKNPEEHRKSASIGGKIGGSKKKSDSHRRKISETISNMVCYTDGITNIKQDKDLPPPDGFRRGMSRKKKQKGH